MTLLTLRISKVSVVLKRKQTAFYITTITQWLIPSKILSAKAEIQLMITLLLSILLFVRKVSLTQQLK